jgi:phosphoserine phosphatase
MLIAFDFDGTLSDSEMTVLLGEEAGVADEIADVTEAAMNDEIGYAESLRRRVDSLEGLSRDEVERAFGRVRLRPGAGDLLGDLQRTDHHVAILTGGFVRGVEAALDRAGAAVDTLVANELGMDAERDVLTGEVSGPLIEGTKDDALDELCITHGIDLDATVAVGDGANDLPMLKVAGLAVGYDPKPAVEPHCDEVVHSMEELRRVFEEHGVF